MSDRPPSEPTAAPLETPSDTPSDTPSGRVRLLRFLRKRWFLVGLLIAIPTGLSMGNAAGEQNPESFAKLATPVICTVLFLMAFTLDSRQLLRSLSNPKAVLFTLLVNIVLLPVLAWPIAGVQLMEDYRVGLTIISTVPCTMAAASVWTRRAGGNDAVSLLVTLLTNGLCFTFTPFWLGWLLDTSVEFDRMGMLIRLLKVALIPSALGQIARLLLVSRLPVDRARGPLGAIAMGGVLVVIFGASMKAGPQIASLAGSTGAAATVLMAVSAVGLHLTAAGFAYVVGRRLLTRPDAIAACFAGSQKTLPIGILIATDPSMLGAAGVPFAILPLLTYHALQLVVDTLIADKMRKKSERLAAEAEAASQPEAVAPKPRIDDEHDTAIIG